MDRRAFAAMLSAMGLGSMRALGATPEGVATDGGANDPEDFAALAKWLDAEQ